MASELSKHPSNIANSAVEYLETIKVKGEVPLSYWTGGGNCYD